jgi:hypothetical protein
MVELTAMVIIERQFSGFLLSLFTVSVDICRPSVSFSGSLTKWPKPSNAVPLDTLLDAFISVTLPHPKPHG